MLVLQRKLDYLTLGDLRQFGSLLITQRDLLISSFHVDCGLLDISTLVVRVDLLGSSCLQRIHQLSLPGSLTLLAGPNSQTSSEPRNSSLSAFWCSNYHRMVEMCW